MREIETGAERSTDSPASDGQMPKSQDGSSIEFGDQDDANKPLRRGGTCGDGFEKSDDRPLGRQGPVGLLSGQDEASIGHPRARHGLHGMVHLINGFRFSNRRFLGHPGHFPLVGDPAPATPFARIGFMNRDERRG